MLTFLQNVFNKIGGDFFVHHIWNNLFLLKIICIICILETVFILKKGESLFSLEEGTKNFDKELFKKSDFILNEIDLREFLDEVYHLRYQRQRSNKVDNYIIFFKDDSSNKYFNKEIQKEFEKFYNSLKKLLGEVYVKANIHPTLYKDNMYRLFTDFEEDTGKKDQIAMDFLALCNDTEKKYIKYRKTIKKYLMM